MRVAGLLALALCLAATACGGDGETETVVQTVTVTAPGPGQDGTAPPVTAARPPQGSPVVLEGRYAVRVLELRPPRIAAGGDSATAAVDWVATTSCDPGCTVELRRELENGGTKTVTLEEDPGRPGQYLAEFTGSSRCLASRTPQRPQSLRVRPTRVEDLDGRPTATGLDAYLRARVRCPTGDVTDAVAIYRGTRVEG
jgi:hypothetical protein